METELVRLVTAGSVDDGKSTLIGRLLYDAKAVLADQLEHVEEVSRRRGGDGPDLALLTDGLRAEREQGITIDVASTASSWSVKIAFESYSSRPMSVDLPSSTLPAVASRRRSMPRSSPRACGLPWPLPTRGRRRGSRPAR